MEELPIHDGVFIGDENDRLEFKSVLKGIPGSVWETYSSFANTFGGRIILGINDRTHEVEGVPDADRKVQDLWNSLNNPQIVNRNVLYSGSIRTYDADGKTLIIMDVPRADRYLRPVYYKSLETGTFRRNGESDYRCRMPEIGLMIRDQSSSSYDSTVLEDMTFDDIDTDSLHAYRNEMRTYSPDHMWNGCTDREFARMIGAVGHSSEHLTVAGLLMFGKEPSINAFLPRFKLDYTEYPGTDETWSYRLVTGDGLWNGNIFNFFSAVRGRISGGIDRPLKIGSDMRRIADTDVHRAVRECLLNTLIHADYLGSLVVKIERFPREIRFSNSGLFRIPLEIAERGGESDPRNAVIAKMFSMIGLMERAGVGISYVFSTWKKQFGKVPVIREDTGNQRVAVVLSMGRKDTFTTGEMIMDLISKDPKISAARMSSEIGVSVPTVKNHLRRLTEEGVVRRVGGTRGHWEIVRMTGADVLR